MAKLPKHGNAVYIVDGSRTPFLKARGKPGPFKAAELAISAAKPLLLRQPFHARTFDQVILGCVNQGTLSPHPSRKETTRAILVSSGPWFTQPRMT